MKTLVVFFVSLFASNQAHASWYNGGVRGTVSVSTELEFKFQPVRSELESSYFDMFNRLFEQCLREKLPIFQASVASAEYQVSTVRSRLIEQRTEPLESDGANDEGTMVRTRSLAQQDSKRSVALVINLAITGEYIPVTLVGERLEQISPTSQDFDEAIKHFFEHGGDKVFIGEYLGWIVKPQRLIDFFENVEDIEIIETVGPTEEDGQKGADVKSTQDDGGGGDGQPSVMMIALIVSLTALSAVFICASAYALRRPMSRDKMGKDGPNGLPSEVRLVEDSSWDVESSGGSIISSLYSSSNNTPSPTLLPKNKELSNMLPPRDSEETEKEDDEDNASNDLLDSPMENEESSPAVPGSTNMHGDDEASEEAYEGVSTTLADRSETAVDDEEYTQSPSSSQTIDVEKGNSCDGAEVSQVPEVSEIEDGNGASGIKSGKKGEEEDKNEEESVFEASQMEESIIHSLREKLLWRAVIDETSGQTYYYNRSTKETTWERPPDMVDSRPPSYLYAKQTDDQQGEGEEESKQEWIAAAKEALDKTEGNLSQDCNSIKEEDKADVKQDNEEDASEVTESDNKDQNDAAQAEMAAREQLKLYLAKYGDSNEGSPEEKDDEQGKVKSDSGELKLVDCAALDEFDDFLEGNKDEMLVHPKEFYHNMRERIRSGPVDCDASHSTTSTDRKIGPVDLDCVSRDSSKDSSSCANSLISDEPSLLRNLGVAGSAIQTENQNGSATSKGSQEVKITYAPPGRLGLALRTENGKTVVDHIRKNSAMDGVLKTGDEIVAVDGVGTTNATSSASVIGLLKKNEHAMRKISYVSPVFEL